MYTAATLDTDYMEVNANLLVETVALLRAGNNESARAIVPAAAITTSPSRGDVWVNGLWLTSLVLSLSTGLFAVLAKQWLRHYASPIVSSSARERAFVRHYRWDGFDKWKVQHIIGLLPVILQIAVLLFFAGLVVWLFPLHTTISRTILGLAGSVGALYVVSTFLPIWAPQCPYRTQIPTIVRLCSRLSAYIAFCSLSPPNVLAMEIRRRGVRGTWMYKVADRIEDLFMDARKRLQAFYRTDTTRKEGERTSALPSEEDIPTRSAHLLEGLFTSTTNASAKRIIFYSQPNWSKTFTGGSGYGPLAGTCADSVLRLRDCVHQMASGQTPIQADQDDICRWASAAGAGDISLSGFQDQLSDLWLQGSYLTVPSMELGILAYSTLYTAQRAINVELIEGDRSYKLTDLDMSRSYFEMSAFLRYHVDGNTVKLPHRVWKCLRSVLSDPSKPTYAQEKDLWTDLLLDAYNHGYDYEQELVYPETYQKPISYAHYCTPFFEAWKWLPINVEDWPTITADFNGDMRFGSVVYRKKQEEDIQCHHVNHPATRTIFVSTKFLEWREHWGSELKDARRRLVEFNTAHQADHSPSASEERQRLLDAIARYERWDKKWPYEPISQPPAESASVHPHPESNPANNETDSSSPVLRAANADEGDLQVGHPQIEDVDVDECTRRVQDVADERAELQSGDENEPPSSRRERLSERTPV